jgi:hypothetical protein
MPDGESLKKAGNIDGHCPVGLSLKGSTELEDVTLDRLHQLDQATVSFDGTAQGLPQPL